MVSKMISNKRGITKTQESDVFMKQVMKRPHSQHKTNIAHTVNGYNFYSIFYRQVPVSVKGNKQKRTEAENFPANKKGFKVSGKHNQIIAEKE